MNCKQIKEELLTDYRDAAANTAARAEVDAHVAQCADCREFAREVGAVFAPFKQLGQLGEVRPPERVWANIQARLHEEQEKVSPWSVLRTILNPRSLGLLVPLAAVTLFLVVQPLDHPANRYESAGRYVITELDVEATGGDLLEEALVEAEEEEAFGSLIEDFFLS